MFFLWAETDSENEVDVALVDYINKEIDENGFNVAINQIELEHATARIDEMIGDNLNVIVNVSRYPNVLCVWKLAQTNVKTVDSLYNLKYNIYK